MPKIPMGNDVGLGNAQYQSSVQTPVLSRPVSKEVGPGLQVNRLDVVDEKAAPLSQIKPVLPSLDEYSPIQAGLDSLSRRAEQFAAIKQQELAKVNDAAEKTSLLVSMGDQKAAYRQNTLDILNNADLSDEDKAKSLQKVEDDFRATIGQTKPAYQPVVAQEVMGTIGTVKNEAQTILLKNRQDGIKADLEKRAAQLTLDAATTGDLEGSLANFDALHGAYKSAGLTDAHFVVDRNRFEQGILQNDIMGNLKSLDVKSGPDALVSVTGLLSRLTEADDNNVPKNWTRLDPATRNADIAAVISRKNQVEADLAANANKQLTQLKSNFSVGMAYYSDALKNGDPVPPNLTIDLHKQAQAMIQLDPDKSSGIMGLLQLQKAEQEFGPAYKMDQQAKDPLFGTGVRPISFQDTSNPEALQAKFADSIKMGQAVKAAKGLTFVPVLRNADMEGIAKTVEANPITGIRMLDTLKTALGNDGTSSLIYISGQMANSKDPAAPATAAIVYNVAKGDMNTAQLVASGMDVIRNKSLTMPKDTDLRSGFDRLIGDAMTENSANRGVNFEAYKTAYAALAARKNLVDGNFDRDTANEAFQRVVGTVTKWNGSSVLIPENMNEAGFKDYLSGISPETVQAWGGIHGMTNEKAADFIKDDATLRAVSPGRYVVEYNGKQALTPGGRRFIIDTRQPLIKPAQPGAERIINTLSTGY